MRLQVSILLFVTVYSFVAYVHANDSLTSPQLKNTGVSRDISPLKYSLGQRLFLKNCATCHGKHAEGAKDWRTPDKDGKNPPPPLNGSGHTWHHSPQALVLVIREGTGKLGGNMPSWKGKLSDEEIRLILSWITAQWPDEIYTAWYTRYHQQN